MKWNENKKKTWQYLQYVFLVSSSTTSGLSLLFDLPMIFSSPPHLQIHFDTKHLLLLPLQSAPLPKTHRNEDRFRCNNTEETRETHYCFALEEGRKKSKSSFRSEGGQTPEGPDEDGPAGCWVYVSAAECLSDGLMSSQRSVKSGVWICCYLRPWIQESLSGWAEHTRFPHSHPLFFALLPPHLSHHYLYCSGWVNVEESSLFDSCDEEVCKLKHIERSLPQMLPAALCTQSVDSNPWNS